MKANLHARGRSLAQRLLPVALVATLAVGMAQPAIAETQIDLVGPSGSGAFGTSVTLLPNGNIVVTDPFYDAGEIADVGAVYLYDGATGALISTLTGSTEGDQVGASPGVVPLSNGNFLVVSFQWDHGAAANAGAVTWASGTTGINGVVSAANSLIGGSTGDQVGWADPDGEPAVRLLNNGNYLVLSPLWDSGAASDAGAVTWGNGATGVSGVVSAANSLVGSRLNDRVGCAGERCSDGVRELSNGNYIVRSPLWDNGAATDAGAVTWGSDTAGVSGIVSAANSLVGDSADDGVGCGDDYCYYGVVALSSGNYLVRSTRWDNGAATDAGAVTWGSGMAGVSGVVSAANSLGFVKVLLRSLAG